MLKTLKKGIRSATECTDVAAFIFATWQIRLCLLCKFISAYYEIKCPWSILQRVCVIEVFLEEMYENFVGTLNSPH